MVGRANAPAAMELGVALTIDQHEGMRHSLRAALGVRSRALNLRINPSMDLIFLCESTMPGNLPCLAALTQPAVTAVVLRRATLSWAPDPGVSIGQGSASLKALARGNCFLTANNQKIPIASFGLANVKSAQIEMDLLGQPNLLEFLRAEFFTLEISGTNRRRLNRPLAVQINLQFDVRMAEPVGATA